MNDPTDEDMNALQLETTLVSDLCLTWADVAECDRAAALEWLWRRKASSMLASLHDMIDSQ